MKYCNCRATRMYDLSTRYIVNLKLLQTDVSIDMVWDTGASKTVIYSPYLKKLKGLGKVRVVGLESYLSQEEQLNGVPHSFSDKYVQLPFAIANGQQITGILCCVSDILIKGFQLKNLNRNYLLSSMKGYMKKILNYYVKVKVKKFLI